MFERYDTTRAAFTASFLFSASSKYPHNSVLNLSLSLCFPSPLSALSSLTRRPSNRVLSAGKTSSPSALGHSTTAPHTSVASLTRPEQVQEECEDAGGDGKMGCAHGTGTQDRYENAQVARMLLRWPLLLG